MVISRKRSDAQGSLRLPGSGDRYDNAPDGHWDAELEVEWDSDYDLGRDHDWESDSDSDSDHDRESDSDSKEISRAEEHGKEDIELYRQIHVPASSSPVMGNVQSAEVSGLWRDESVRFQEDLDNDERAIFQAASPANLQKIIPKRFAYRFGTFFSALRLFEDELPMFAPTSFQITVGCIRVVLLSARARGNAMYRLFLTFFPVVGQILKSMCGHKSLLSRPTSLRLAQSIHVAFLDVVSVCAELKGILQVYAK